MTFCPGSSVQWPWLSRVSDLFEDWLSAETHRPDDAGHAVDINRRYHHGAILLLRWPRGSGPIPGIDIVRSPFPRFRGDGQKAAAIGLSPGGSKAIVCCLKTLWIFLDECCSA